jgi:hypothetical protein
MRLPERVTICKVGPRDGLQNEAVNVPMGDKIRLLITQSAESPVHPSGGVGRHFTR